MRFSDIKFLQNPLFQFLLLLLFLFVIRGGEGLFQPLSIDFNDTLVFSEILKNRNLPDGSISVQYAKFSENAGLALLPGKIMDAVGLSSQIQFFTMYFIQITVLCFGLLYFFRAFRKEFVFILLGFVIAYLSAFTGFGRYLALGAGFKIVSSGLALGFGFIILGCFLRGRLYSAIGLTSLLALYHPTHAAVLLFILGVYTFWNNIFVRKADMKSLLRIGIYTAFCLIPFVVLYWDTLSSDIVFDKKSWWAYVFSKTSNLTPLQDGLFVVLGITGAFAFGIVSLLARKRDPDLIETSQRAIFIIVGALMLWAIQIIFTEFIPLITIAKLALTRVSPYAVIVLVAILCERVYDAFIRGDKKDRFYGFLMAVAAIGLGLPAWLPILKIPTMTPPLIDLDFLFQGNVLEQISICFLMAGLSWWMWYPQINEERKKIWTRVLWVGTIFFIIFFGLRFSSLAVLLMLVIIKKPAWEKFIPQSTTLLCILLSIAATFVFIARKPWAPPSKDLVEIRAMVEKHVPPENMVLTLPWRSAQSELLIPSRANFLGYGECQYVFYMPQMIDTIWRRAGMLGLQPVNESSEVCKNWLFEPMCRRQYFEARAKEENNIWRLNFDQIRKEAPKLSHVLIPESMLCKGEAVVDRIGDMVLLAVRDVVKQGCQGNEKL